MIGDCLIIKAYGSFFIGRDEKNEIFLINDLYKLGLLNYTMRWIKKEDN